MSLPGFLRFDGRDKRGLAAVATVRRRPYLPGQIRFLRPPASAFQRSARAD